MKFVADGNLSRLAKRLRILGFDCYYDGGMSLIDAINLAAEEQRILLTTKPIADTLKVKSVKIESYDVDEQMRQLSKLFSLADGADPFSRCLVCNVLIVEESDPDPEEVPESVVERGLELYRCPECRRVYWHGSHVERMKGQIANSIINILH